MDVVSGGENSMANEMTGGTITARRGDVSAALHAWAGGAHDDDRRHRSKVDHARRLIRPSVREAR